MIVYSLVNKIGTTFRLEIELSNSALSNKWKIYLQKTCSRVGNLDWQSDEYIVESPQHKNINIQLFKIFRSFSYLNTHLPYDFNEELDIIEKWVIQNELVSQDRLNKWHRYFTTLADGYFKEHIIIPPNCNRDELYSHLHTLNTHIHKLELKNINQKRSKLNFGNQFGIHVSFDWNRISTLVNGVWSPEYMEELTPGFFNIFDNEYDCNVWMSDDIQGKDLIRAWLDDDDLTMNDVTGNQFMTPNIILDPYNSYKNILDNTEFRESYLRSNKHLDRIPLGNIINLDKIDWKNFYGSKIESISIDNEKIWRSP